MSAGTLGVLTLLNIGVSGIVEVIPNASAQCISTQIDGEFLSGNIKAYVEFWRWKAVYTVYEWPAPLKSNLPLWGPCGNILSNSSKIRRLVYGAYFKYTENNW